MRYCHIIVYFLACQPGYYGKLCNTTCPPGYFGLKCGGICITECLDCHHVNGCLSDFEKTIESKSSGKDIKSKLRKAAHEKNKKQRESNENWFTKRNVY